MEIRKSFCTECEKDVKIKKETRENVQRLIGGKLITGNLIVCHCTECGAIVSIPEYERLNDKEFFSKYRQECGLLQPEEIKATREKYGLSQANFAKLLGMGEKTITRYENGSVQDEAHDNLIRAAKDENYVRSLYNLRNMDFEIKYPITVNISEFYNSNINLQCDYTSKGRIENPEYCSHASIWSKKQQLCAYPCI